MAKFFSKELVFLLIIAFSLEIIGNALGFYMVFEGYDIVTHFIGGALVSAFGIKILLPFLKQQAYFVNVVFTVGVGGFWEVTEFTLDLLFNLGLQSSLFDTMIDLVMVILAAIIINLIYFYKNR